MPQTVLVQSTQYSQWRKTLQVHKNWVKKIGNYLRGNDSFLCMPSYVVTTEVLHRAVASKVTQSHSSPFNPNFSLVLLQVKCTKIISKIPSVLCNSPKLF